MKLSCPKCQSENTQKISLLKSEKAPSIAPGGNWFFANLTIPALAILLAVMSLLISGFLSLAFLGLGFFIRQKVLSSTKTKYDGFSADMKKSGFVCNRCEHTFIPAE